MFGKISEQEFPCHNCDSEKFMTCYSGETKACEKFIKWSNKIIEKKNKELTKRSKH